MYDQKFRGRKAKCVFRESEENNLVEAECIDWNNKWTSWRRGYKTLEFGVNVDFLYRPVISEFGYIPLSVHVGHALPKPVTYL